MRCLITGVSGFVGSRLAQKLMALGHEVEGWDIVEPTVKLTAFHALDLAEDRPLLTYGRETTTHVFHLASPRFATCQDRPARGFATNVAGTQRLVDWAGRAGVRKFVFASTGSVEEPKSWYAVSKLAAEAVMRAANAYYPDLSWDICRLYNVFGPGQKTGVIPTFISKARAGGRFEIDLPGYQTRRFTWIDDVVDALIWCAEKSWAPRTWGNQFEVVSDVQISVVELARMISRLVGVEPDITYRSQRKGEIYHFHPSNCALTRWGLTFRSDLETMLAEVIGG